MPRLGCRGRLGFSDRVFGLGAGIFFISYVALQIPGALMVEHWSARRCIALIMMAWGSLTVLTGLVHTPGQLYAARVLLGAAEAGFFPGVVVYLSHWFVRKDRAKATSKFMAAIPLSFIIGSPLAGWILGHPWLGVDGWRWLFALEGLPAILLGAVAFFYLTDWPREAAWLAPEQREWIEQKLEEEKPARHQKITAWRALHSRPILMLAAVAFCEYFVAYTVAFWLPTILKRQSGFSDLRVGLLGTLAVRSGIDGDADQRMALRQNERTAVALGDSAVHRGDRIVGPHYFAAFDAGLGHILYHAVPGVGVPTGVLDDAERDSQRIGGRRRRGPGERGGEHRRFCWSVRVRLLEHPDGIVLVWIGADDGLRDCRRVAGVAGSGGASRIFYGASSDLKHGVLPDNSSYESKAL